MRGFHHSWLLPALLVLALIAGFITSETRRIEGSDAARIRTICEQENITDVQTYECTVRMSMHDSKDQLLGQR
jgi:hypothetical protein